MEITKSKIKHVTMNTTMALGITLTIPWITHLIGLQMNLGDPSLLGKLFLPMHIGVFMTALFFGPTYGLIIGGLAPMISSVLTGMPISAPMPIMQIMVFELLAYGLVTGYVNNKLEIKNKEYISILSGMVAGRLVVFSILSFGILNLNAFTPASYMMMTIKTGYIGIFLQILLIPFIVKMINKNKER